MRFERIGSYDVTALIGEGGMGQVYQATDTKLNRQVALKILPEAFATDPDRLARFQREAQVLASLNHPNIAAIHGLEDSEGTKALVLELVEGPTLADRIAKGPIPVDEALPIAKQIAEALEAAHEQGVIHRDLKPANIKVKSDGMVKVLDFGLAKALDTTPEGDPSQSPTLTAAATQMGVIMGTAAYMSPEQAAGQTADKRSDIWSFGVVLFEMLTGQCLFTGETVSHVLAKVLDRELDFSALPTSTPAPIRRLLRRCLERKSKRRLSDVGEALSHLEEAATAPAEDSVVAAVVAPVVQPAGSRRALPLAVAASVVVGIITGLAVWSVMQPESPRVVRFAVSPDDAVPLFTALASPDIAISPDSEHIAYLTGSVGNGAERLHVRPLDQFTSETLVAEGELNSPFFSPDGESVGFYDRRGGGGNQVLQRVSVRGGPTSTICELPADLRSASWEADGTIVFAASDPTSGLWRVPAVGGEPELLTTPEEGQDHWWPEILPGGEAVLFTTLQWISPISTEDAQIAVLSLETGEVKVIGPGSYPRYSATGHVVYGVEGNLWAVAFDLSRLETVGDPVPVQEGVLTKAAGTANFSVSENGSLVYVPGGAETSQARTLLWVDRNGEEEPLAVPEGQYVTLSLSPDGTRAAFTLLGGSGNADVWVSELARGTLTRLTTDEAADVNPLWSPDGRRVAFSSPRDGQPEMFWQSADGSGTAERLLTIDESVGRIVPYDWSPDGATLFVQATFPETTGRDVGMVSVEGPGTWEPLIQTAANEGMPALSPDGRWLAYASNETGRDEVYVQRFPELEGRTAISVGGGRSPSWSADGRELFYLRAPAGPPDAVMRVTLDVDEGDPPSLIVGTPERLFDWSYFSQPVPFRYHDVSPDGQRFLMIRRPGTADDGAERTEINVVQNWTEELKRLVPVD